MNRTEDQVNQVWEEIIIKETLKTIMAKLDKIEEEQINNRRIIKEKLTVIQTYLEKLNTFNNPLTEKTKQPELTTINIIGRDKEPITTDISNSKPKITKGVKRAINGLAELHKQGKF